MADRMRSQVVSNHFARFPLSRLDRSLFPTLIKEIPGEPNPSVVSALSAHCAQW